MFYVFGPAGAVYQGGPDRLAHITPVRGVQRPRGLGSSATGVDARDAAARQAAHAAVPRPAQGAVAAYASTLQGPKTKRQPLHLVRDVMTRGAITVAPDWPALQAWELLVEHQIAQAPVVDAQQRLVGLLLRADMAPLATRIDPRVERRAYSLAHQPVSALMVTPVAAVDEDTDLRRVANVLLETGLPGLPVTHATGHLSGFVSRTDLLRAVASDPPLDLWG